MRQCREGGIGLRTKQPVLPHSLQKGQNLDILNKQGAPNYILMGCLATALPIVSSAGNKCRPSRPGNSPPVRYELHPQGRKCAPKITQPQQWFLHQQLPDGRSTDVQMGKKGEILQNNRSVKPTSTLQQTLQLITVIKHTLRKRSDQFRSKHGFTKQKSLQTIFPWKGNGKYLSYSKQSDIAKRSWQTAENDQI